MRLALLFTSALAVTALTACDSEDDNNSSDSRYETRTHTGAGDAGLAVAAVFNDDRLTVYVCGGDENFDTHTGWYRDLEVADDGTFSGSNDGFELRGSVQSDSVQGTLVDPAGNELAWDTDPAPSDALQGLYTADVDGCTTGVVVWTADTGQAEAQGTWCNAMAEFDQVIILPPLDLTAEGINVEVDRPDGRRMFAVQRF